MIKQERTKKHIETMESLTGAAYDKKRDCLQKTPFPIKETLKQIDIIPPPGMYYMRIISEDFLVLKKGSIIPPKDISGKTFKDLEDIYYSDNRMCMILSVGDNFVTPYGTEQKQIAKERDVVIASINLDRPPRHIFYKGYILFLIGNSDILGIVERNADLRLLEDQHVTK